GEEHLSLERDVKLAQRSGILATSLSRRFVAGGPTDCRPLTEGHAVEGVDQWVEELTALLTPGSQGDGAEITAVGAAPGMALDQGVAAGGLLVEVTAAPPESSVVAALLPDASQEVADDALVEEGVLGRDGGVRPRSQVQGVA